MTMHSRLRCRFLMWVIFTLITTMGCQPYWALRFAIRADERTALRKLEIGNCSSRADVQLHGEVGFDPKGLRYRVFVKIKNTGEAPLYYDPQKAVISFVELQKTDACPASEFHPILYSSEASGIAVGERRNFLLEFSIDLGQCSAGTGLPGRLLLGGLDSELDSVACELPGVFVFESLGR